MSTALSEAPTLNLGRSIKWMFASPKWANNLLWSAICVLLGSLIIGSLVMLGYQMEIIQRRSRGREYDMVDFDPNRFLDYLVRGLIPAAVYLIVTAVFSTVVYVIMGVWMGVFMAVTGANPKDGMALLMLLPVIAMGILHVVGMACVAMPLALRAGLANDFTEGIKLKWALNTAALLWPSILLAMLYVVLCSFLSFFGILLCFVGIFVTTAWLQLVMADLGAQLVDIYYAKGGQPLPMHGEALQAELM